MDFYLALEGPAGTIVDIPGGWVTIIGLLITGLLSPIAVAMYGARISRRSKEIEKGVAATREQVTNGGTNMRVEGTENHEAVMEELQGLRRETRTLHQDVSFIREGQETNRRANVNTHRVLIAHIDKVPALIARLKAVEENTQPSIPVKRRKPQQKKEK